MLNYILTSDGELYHYGVKGQKWGVRRAQKKAARKAAREARDAELTPEQRKKRTNIKRGITIGAAAAGTALAAFGAYKLHKAIDNHAWEKACDIGRKKVKERDDMLGIAKVVIKEKNGFEMDMTAHRVRKEADRVYNAMRYGDKVKYFVNDLRKK